MFFHFSKEEFKSFLKEVIREVLTEEKAMMADHSTMIDIQEAASLLNLAVATIYEKTSERTIPHYKRGKKIMFRKSELLAWLEEGKVRTKEQLSAEVLTLRRRRQ